MKSTYNKSQIFKKAWQLFKFNRKFKSLSDALKSAWAKASYQINLASVKIGTKVSYVLMSGFSRGVVVDYCTVLWDDNTTDKFTETENVNITRYFSDCSIGLQINKSL